MLTAEKMTARHLYRTLKNIRTKGGSGIYSLEKCEQFIPIINEIQELKEKRNAVILVHTYVSSEIMYGVGDHTGDSYALSKKAMETDADVIVFASVRFMGETAKILNPHKEVFVPGQDGGCDLADCINARQVRELRSEFPLYTFVCYVNTPVEVKAECDVCVTSANIYAVIKNIPNDKIYFLPDRLMGENMKRELKRCGIKKDVRYFTGACSVHEKYTTEQISRIRKEYPNVKVASHPECLPEVCEKSDYVGSTSQMLNYVKETDAEEFFLLTECGLSARIQAELTGKKPVGESTVCPFMKSNRLEDILRVLKTPDDKDRVIIDENIRLKALKSLEAMFRYA